MSAVDQSVIPDEIRERAESLRIALVDRFGSELSAADKIGLAYTSLRTALRPEDNHVERDSTWAKRLAKVERLLNQFDQKVSADTSAAGGAPPPAAHPLAGRSITDLLDDPERDASDPKAGLARAGGGLVARGFDADGLLYAVEIVFHLRPGSRDTHHEITPTP